MSDLTFRPRFKFHSDMSIDEIADRLSQYAITNGSDQIKLKKTYGHFVLDIKEPFKHFWSPHMDVNIENDKEEGKSLVRCMIGPTPTVWTMFMFFYGFFGFLAFIGLTLGMAQWTLKKDMWGLWLLPVSLIGMLMMYFISYEGKKLSKNEMIAMKTFLDGALECDCFKLSRDQGHI